MAVTENLKIGFIGAGNMGRALISALLEKMPSENISVFDTDPGKLSSLPRGINIKKTEIETAASCDIIILAVKPFAVAQVLEKIKSVTAPVVVSVAAGVTIAAMSRVLGEGRPVIRVMPNTPLAAGEGMSVLCASGTTPEDKLNEAAEIFRAAGRVMILPETLMDAVTGLSGSGPAFVFTFIQALTDGGVKAGIPRQAALELAAQTVLGAAKMVLHGMNDPMSLRGMVTSPGGTTIEGVHVLESAGFSGTVMSAVEAAAAKSKKIGEGK
jgi:pyrroline-5-carboxylate reductase